MSEAKLFIGVDGGGSKTEAAVADVQEKILGTGKSGPANYHVVGLKQAVNNIDRAINLAIAQSKKKLRISDYELRVRATCLGLASVDSNEDLNLFHKTLKKKFSQKYGRVEVFNDVVIGLHSGTQKGYGCGIIAGTGSNCYAVGKSGKVAWAAGIGHQMSDNGGAVWLTAQMLSKIGKSYDGRGPKTKLEQLFINKLGVANVRSAVRVLYEMFQDKTSLATLAPIIEQAAARGDKVAKELLKAAGDELALMATTVARKVDLQKISFDIVMVGSVWNVKILQDKFKRQVRKATPRARFVRPRARPVIGAVRLAIAGTKTKKF
jgi:N-acetylglucosamine kinase-like BadF-type ATPase